MKRGKKIKNAEERLRDLKIYTNNIEDKAREQFDLLLEQEPFKTLEEILKQNEQLKEEKENLTNIVANKLICDYDIETPLKDQLAEERRKIVALEDALHIERNNWKLLEEWLKEEIKRNSGNSIDLAIRSHLLLDILSKMQEIRGDKSD